ncbi:ATP-binding protein [Parafilimonas sp.]|uniref:sensor histidine kinase n=1 Tax=Parafilimonas sp. TaxID=1969739 RepID=UPI003F7CFC0C
MTLNSTNGFNNHSLFFRLLIIFYIVLISGLIILRVSFYHYNETFNKGSALVSQTRTIIESTDSILLLSQNLQWQCRNYILIADSNAYETCISIRDSLLKKVNRLIQLFNNDSYQYANAARLRQQIMQLGKLTDTAFNVKETPAQIFSIANIKQDIVLHNAISQQIGLIKSEESRLLAIRRAAIFKTVDAARQVFTISGILILVLLTGTFVFIYYHFKKTQRAEKKLIESEDRFQVLINSTKDLSIFMMDKDGIILNWYEGAHTINGYTSDEAIGKHMSIFYTPEAIANGEPEYYLQLAAAQGSFETEGWRVRKDGSLFWADVLITAIYNENGKVQGFTKVTRDFSLQKRVTDEVKNMLQKEKNLNEMKSNFVSMASHEFRTPLSTVLSSVSLLEHYTTTETQDKRDKHIQRIKSSVGEMVTILEEFLSIEKIEEGKVQLKKETFNLKELAQQLYTKFSTALKKGQTIIYEHIGKEEVFLDVAFINHILNNLLSNAVKYSPEGSEVIFKTNVKENTITLKIQDHGIGIAPKDQEHLFERFFRGSNTGNIKGTGLGLHIVKRYIDLMQGSIYLESDIEKGSIFTVILPC